jgi:hypothetical protein
MNPMCEQVAERTALGESLDDLASHAASCERCQRVTALPAKLAATAHAADPGMGFASRMTAGAQHRITTRRRQRYAAGASLALAAAAVVALVVMREPEPASVAYVPLSMLPHLPGTTPPTAQKDPGKAEPGKIDEDVRALVHLANVERNRHLSAHWGRIEKSLAPYRAVIKGTEP